MRSLEPPLLIIIVQNMRNENVPQRQYLLELRLTKAVCSHEKIVSVPGLTTFLMIFRQLEDKNTLTSSGM